ncbi:MAG: hypothetical protein AB2L20_12490 [Mangrovibacterium sp.]
MAKNSSSPDNFGFDPRFPLVENEPLTRIEIVSGFLFAHNFHTTRSDGLIDAIEGVKILLI